MQALPEAPCLAFSIVCPPNAEVWPRSNHGGAQCETAAAWKDPWRPFPLRSYFAHVYGTHIRRTGTIFRVKFLHKNLGKNLGFSGVLGVSWWYFRGHCLKHPRWPKLMILACFWAVLNSFMPKLTKKCVLEKNNSHFVSQSFLICEWYWQMTDFKN